MITMIEYDEDRTSVVDTAIMSDLGCKEEIDLYNELSMALELMEGEFDVVDGDIDNGVSFQITTKFPHGLPDDIGIMFFNADPSFDVEIKETSKYVFAGERHFEIKLKKV